MRMFARSLLVLACTCTSACSQSATPATEVVADGSGLPADRPILDWTGTTAIDHNAAQLPADFEAADQTMCADDPTRQYIGELIAHGIKNPQVDFHWAPVIRGKDPERKHRSLSQPEWDLAGEVLEASDGDGDVLFDHPFGPDFNAQVHLDAPYVFLSGIEHEAGEKSGYGEIHTEYERRISPRIGLGFHQKPGDRVLHRGVWILDCGHPPYSTEMHPPTFSAYAREEDAQTTTAMAFVLPYRSALLFSLDLKVAMDLTNTARFDADDTDTFPRALVSAVVAGVTGDIPNLTSHGLMMPNHFDKLDWQVCAPLPRPKGAKLAATWRFATRTGVTVTATPDEASGCVRFVATMGADYVPMPMTYLDAPWDWAGLSSSAGDQLGQSVDVRKEIVKLIAGMGLSTDASALQADHPPYVDAYAPLQPRAGADQDAPTAIDAGADDQPYPFYGRARVAWGK